MADLTRIMTGEGVLWLASIRDAFSNKVVGWASAARADTELALTALGHALRSRNIHDGQLIHHSDKGCQYTALRFTQRLADAGVAPSTGSVGDSYDNALAENLWSTIKTELIYWPGNTFGTRAEAEARSSATSTAGTTPGASSKDSMASHPTSTRKPGTANTSPLRSTPSRRIQIIRSPAKRGNLTTMPRASSEYSTAVVETQRVSEQQCGTFSEMGDRPGRTQRSTMSDVHGRWITNADLVMSLFYWS